MYIFCQPLNFKADQKSFVNKAYTGKYRYDVRVRRGQKAVLSLYDATTGSATTTFATTGWAKLRLYTRLESTALTLSKRNSRFCDMLLGSKTSPSFELSQIGGEIGDN